MDSSKYILRRLPLPYTHSYYKLRGIIVWSHKRWVNNPKEWLVKRQPKFLIQLTARGERGKKCRYASANLTKAFAMQGFTGGSHSTKAHPHKVNWENEWKLRNLLDHKNTLWVKNNFLFKMVYKGSDLNGTMKLVCFQLLYKQNGKFRWDTSRKFCEAGTTWPRCNVSKCCQGRTHKSVNCL